MLTLLNFYLKTVCFGMKTLNNISLFINKLCFRLQSRLNPVPESLNSPDIIPGI